MTKLLSALIAATFAVAPVAYSAEKMDKKTDALAEACKGKKAGDKVTVDGKETTCPAAKKEAK